MAKSAPPAPRLRKQKTHVAIGDIELLMLRDLAALYGHADIEWTVGFLARSAHFKECGEKAPGFMSAKAAHE